MELQDIHKDILALCAADETGLWLIIKRVAKDQYSLEQLPTWVQSKTIEVIGDLLRKGLIEVGNPNGPTFEPISDSLEETIAFIEREWDKLGKTPNIGDLCWVRATSAGEQLARELDL